MQMATFFEAVTQADWLTYTELIGLLALLLLPASGDRRALGRLAAQLCAEHPQIDRICVAIAETGWAEII
jgi:hypothetical protein